VGRFVERVWPGNPSGATRAERASCRFRAYVPDLLVGADVALPASVAADLVDVEQSVRQLNSHYPGLANLEPLARFLMRAEAVASSNIEGLRLNVRRLARSEAAQREGFEVNDATARAVLGNIRALDEALDRASDPVSPVTVEDLKAIHRALLTGTREEPWAGVIRTEQNWIGGVSPCAAAFVPPPVEHVAELLADLAEYLSGDEHPALLQAAIAHAQFETIHPFADGNGRTGRAVIQLVLRRRGVAAHVVPPVSLVLATRANDYVAALDGTRAEGDNIEGMLTWVDLFLSATGRACRDADGFSADLAKLDADSRQRLGNVRANSTVDLLVSALPALPVFSVSAAAAHVGRSFPVTGEAVERLRAANVVKQVTIGRRNRAFEAVGLFEAFTGFERVLASPDADMSPPARPAPARP
jgi:Fic family protein